MENELVGFACNLVDAPPEAVGTVTSGGTESCLLSVQAARDARPRDRPPQRRHGQHRACGVPQGCALLQRRPARRARGSGLPAPTRPPWRRRSTTTPCSSWCRRPPTPTVWSTRFRRSQRLPRPAASAATSTPASAAGCCRTPAGSGAPSPPWTFAVEGVTSISVDTHKYAYAPKGTSLLLHRSSALRKPQYFASADWPGYTMINSTLQSTKSGGPLAGAWAVVQALGDEGYLDAGSADLRDGRPDRRGHRGGSRAVARRTPRLDAGRRW